MQNEGQGANCLKKYRAGEAKAPDADIFNFSAVVYVSGIYTETVEWMKLCKRIRFLDGGRNHKGETDAMLTLAFQLASASARRWASFGLVLVFLFPFNKF